MKLFFKINDIVSLMIIVQVNFFFASVMLCTKTVQKLYRNCTTIGHKNFIIFSPHHNLYVFLAGVCKNEEKILEVLI